MVDRIYLLEAEAVTRKHIQRISELLGEAAIELIKRGALHDASKMDPEELVLLAEMQELIEKEGQAPYGSPEYDHRTALLKPMLEHHYSRNTHHPEHFDQGIEGMELFDLMEMCMDWKAASERGGESRINLTHSAERYGISKQLCCIIANTFEHSGWKYK